MAAWAETMTSRTGNRRSSGAPVRTGAFTLIELILVMAVLSVVISLGAPTLARFFRGRALDEEGQRLLAVTRYGQGGAGSEGVPIILWMKASDGTYGLRVQEGYTGTGGGSGSPSGTGKDVKFQLADRLHFALSRVGRIQNQEATIRFAPNGAIDEDSSLQRVEIRQDDGDSIAIVESDNKMNYVIEQKTNSR